MTYNDDLLDSFKELSLSQMAAHVVRVNDSNRFVVSIAVTES